MLAFAVLNQRCEQHNARVLGIGHHMIDHLAHGLCLQGDAMFWAAWFSHACIQ